MARKTCKRRGGTTSNPGQHPGPHPLRTLFVGATQMFGSGKNKKHGAGPLLDVGFATTKRVNLLPTDVYYTNHYGGKKTRRHRRRTHKRRRGGMNAQPHLVRR